MHRSPTLDRLVDVYRDADGLPVTTVSRTLVDLADVLMPRQLERVCRRAEILRHLDAAAIDALLIRRPGRRARGVRNALASLAIAGADITRSELEERFLRLVARSGLSRRTANAVVRGYEVDFLWPAERLIAETDGAATHLTPTAFEQDRRRDAALQVVGFRVVRFTWRQVTQEPQAVADTLRALLGSG